MTESPLRSILMIFLMLALFAAGASIPPVSATPDSNPAGAVPAADRSASILFIENVGQFDEGVRFQVHSATGALWLTEEAIWLTVMERAPQGAVNVAPIHDQTALTGQEAPEPRPATAIRLSFEGANPDATLEPFEPLDATVSYLLGSDPDGWHAAVPVWGGVRYTALYPGVDLELTGASGQWLARLVARDGAPPAVRLRVEGAAISKVADGMLHLESTAGPVEVPLPASDSGFIVVGEDAVGMPVELRVASRSSAQDERGQEVSANSLLASTFFGGTQPEDGQDIGIDDGGNVYVMGNTLSLDLPVTPGVLYEEPPGGKDLFVAKFSPDLSTLLYATYVGGDQDDEGASLAVDGAGNAFVAGGTWSSTFPTTPDAYDPTFNGVGGDTSDSFIIKLNASGTALVYGTFLDDPTRDHVLDMDVSPTGSAYLVGRTNVQGMTSEEYRARLNPNATALLYDIEFEPFETASSVLEVDRHGYSYEAGSGQSRYGGYYYIWVTKRDPQGQVLFTSPLIFWEHYAFVEDVALDNSGHVNLTGTTFASDFPTTPGAYDETFNGGQDAFLVKVSAEIEDEILYSTFLGGSGIERGAGLVADHRGNVAIVGHTTSDDFPTTAGAFSTTFSGGTDVFLTQLNATGSDLRYSTFLGGDGDEEAHGVALMGLGSVHLTGSTDSAAFPTTSGAFDETYNGAGDAFISRFALPVPTLASNYTSGAPGSYFTIDATGLDPDATLEVKVNGVSLGTVTSDEQGTVSFLLHTDDADPGTYVVTVGDVASAVITLDPAEPVRPQEGNGPLFEMPAGSAYVQASYLPVIFY